ncbi:MAG: copper resistance protein CopC/CopD, partial [Actinomycetota bacterium]|nr:copper resistance protein CopC/CopD [Actinomycetota bacterium]
MRRVASFGTLVIALVLAPAAPAVAHAELRSSVPANGATLTEAPRQVVLRFTQDVETTFGSVRIFDAAARRVDDGRVAHAGGDRAAVVVAVPRLADGPYVVTWRVVSADAHTARGAITFHVGAAPAADSGALARRLLAAGGESAAAGALSTTVRLVGFASLALFVGGVWFLALVWPAGRRPGRARRILVGAGTVALAATVAGIGLQGVTAAGLPPADAVRPTVLTGVLDTRFGRLSAARAVLLAAGLAYVLLRAARPAGGRRAAVVPLGLAVLATVSLSGHASSGHLVPLAVAADVVHLAAISAWLGGLVLVGSCVLRQETDAPAVVVRRFSAMAFAAVAAIIASGAFQAWRQVGSVDALTATTYGRLLVAKLALFAALLAVAGVSRRAVHRRWGAALAVPGEPGTPSPVPL